MKEAMNLINQAFGFLSNVLVNGDNVDHLAAARQALRVAYGRLEELERKEATEDGGNDRNSAPDAV